MYTVQIYVCLHNLSHGKYIFPFIIFMPDVQIYAVLFLFNIYL